MRHFGAAKRMHFNATTTKWKEKKNMQTQLCLRRRRQSKIMRLIDVATPCCFCCCCCCLSCCCCCCYSSIEVQVHCLACGDLFLPLEGGCPACKQNESRPRLPTANCPAPMVQVQIPRWSQLMVLGHEFVQMSILCNWDSVWFEV